MGYDQYDGNKRYLDKITSEHRVRPKFMAMTEAYLDKLQDVYDFYVQILNAFDLDTASGLQLNALGEIVGARRVLDFNPYYAESKLNDEQYRKLIRAQITTNQWDGTMRGLIELWETVFSSYSVKVLDRQDMSMLIQFRDVEDLFESELIERGYFAPRPEGVMVNYIFLFESTVTRELFAGSAVVAELITDQLVGFKPEDAQANAVLFIGGALVDQRVCDRILDFTPVSMATAGASFYGGKAVCEIITERLEGDGHLE